MPVTCAVGSSGIVPTIVRNRSRISFDVSAVT